MIVERHEVDAKKRKQAYSRVAADLGEFVSYAYKAPDSLTGVTTIGSSCYRLGSLFDANAPIVGRAIQLVAQANTAIVVFAQKENLGEEFRLDDGPPLRYERPVSPEWVHAGVWVEGFFLALISRQPALLDRLATVPTTQLRLSPSTGPEVTYQWVDLFRALWTEPDATTHPAYAWLLDFARPENSKGTVGKANRYLGLPYLEMIGPLVQGDAANFGKAFGNALKQHKKYYSSSERTRNDGDGWVSIRLTSLAALAWDRGLRFDVESDYAPTSWVRGDLFRT